ncbi:MAG: tRNA (adenosine(37)-N6)-dimethylallyltransferase MiaA [Clostridia bacterium]|nr:tRNA (adenosine(37)-N6)-dimethylallyltransferase MiaA [Clostridia bacterium]
MRKIPIIVVSGPTASGKTALAIALAKKFNAEVISADSMQIYKEMDIGTAKPTTAEMDGIVHHMIDIIEPSESFSVADFVKKSHTVAEDITNRGKTVILAGGTGLYIDSFLKDIDFDEEQNSYVREELEKRLQKDGIEGILEELKRVDSVSYERLHPNNTKRILRAVEFYRLHNIPISEYQKKTQQKESRYVCINFLINHDREVLRNRIDKRVDIMMETGLLEEAKKLWDKKELLSDTAKMAIGYKELFGYFEGNKTIEEATNELKTRSKQYAKRQMTWFKRNRNIHFLNPETAIDDAIILTEKFLKENTK